VHIDLRKVTPQLARKVRQWFESNMVASLGMAQNDAQDRPGVRPDV
jgi:hypothetical protein